MRKYFVAGNWKMNGSRESISALVIAIVKAKLENYSDHLEVALASPFVYLGHVNNLLDSSTIALSAQDVSEYEQGAYTGEVSSAMLADFNCAYCIVGHSERRRLFLENDNMVARKFEALQSNGITPIFCVGETLDEREAEKTEEVVLRQLNAVIESLGISSLSRAVLAYEPVWAIGTGKTATPEQAQQVHKALREQISEFSEEIAAELQIIYGGSVTPETAKALFNQPDIDGGLVGGASLNPEKFVEICKVLSS